MAKKKAKRRIQRVFKKRPCRLCKQKIKSVDYKDVEFLSRFISDKGRILPSRISGNCAKHQRMVANQIKQARIAAFLPFVKAGVGTRTRPPFFKTREERR